MTEPLKAQIIRVRDAPQLSAVGTVTQIRAVDYTVGQHGPFTVMIPLEEFTAEKAKAAVDAAAKEIIASLA